MSNVLEFKPKHDPHNTGDAMCLECGHEWVAVVPESVEWFECPSCGLHKGRWNGPFFPPNGYKIFVCNCGCEYFMKLDSGHLLCPNCGIYHDDE